MRIGFAATPRGLVAPFRLAERFAKMQENGELGRSSAVRRDLAIGVLCAIQGGLPLAKTSRSEEQGRILLMRVAP
jgi:hypothetical protein